jgi:RimJ/RimL family protein N-acetyltransferase
MACRATTTESFCATMPRDLSNWTPRPAPARTVLDGLYCRLEPLDIARHADQLFEASMAEGAEERHRYLFEPPAGRAVFDAWLATRPALDDPMFFVVIDKASGRVEGRQCLMRIDRVHGVIEIGSILWGPRIARTRVATEALYLFAKYAFDDLGYRRFEWKCHNGNEPSKRAALRFGFTFEGVFRQHMVTKGRNRDTAWFAMIDADWPAIKAGCEAWLDPSNFDAEGQQKRRLEACRERQTMAGE